MEVVSFFFSSRRRHTRCSRDWSSDVCSSDLEIRRNHLFKPLSWKVGHPTYAGIHWPVKNLFELKNAQRVLVEGNLFENNWLDAQNGFGILFTVRNQDGTAPRSVVQDVTFTNNIVRHSGSGVNILGYDNNHPSQQIQRILIRNNLFDDISGPAWGGPGRLVQLVDGTASVVIDHNTAFQSGDFLGAFLVGGNRPHTGFVFTNNIAPNNQLGLNGQNTAGNPQLTLRTYFPGAVFAKNVLVSGKPSDYASENFFPALLHDAGFLDLRAGNYRLAVSSRYKKAGTDGNDVGVDFEALLSASAAAGQPAQPAGKVARPQQLLMVWWVRTHRDRPPLGWVICSRVEEGAHVGARPG